ncbi:MAG: M14 family zinc carboxypeptidase [Planctomycetota bacterium]|nr:M14 family zinc carboxypeptidase [Planctomycetota bacterium]
MSKVTERALRASFDIVPGPANRLDVILSPAEYPAFQKLGYRTTLVARGRPFRDLAEMPDSRYYTPAEIEAKIDTYVAAYPALAKKIDLSLLSGGAKTHEGRSMFGLKVSDNVASDEDEPAILLASQHHARELTTPIMLFTALDNILGGYATNRTIRNVVNGYELVFVPCVNPDGVNAVWTRDNYWRKNMRGGYGVDLNRNYPFLWGMCGASSSTRSQTYKGPSAGSEPETRTMMALHRLYQPEMYLDFHSSGREVLFTYAPCATVSSTIRTFIQGYADRLRSPMSFATRAPSASGEAPEFHWSNGGAMSFLTEVNTSFQPDYSLGVAEAARVWPGILAALTTWRPAVRGHVTSIYKNQPVVATITYTPNSFSHGEQSASRSRDGRFAVWLPRGNYQIRFAASGYRTVTRSVSITTPDQPKTMDVVMIPNMAPATLTKSGTDRLGTTSTLTYTSTSDANEQFWIVLSLGNTPGLAVGAGRTIGLNADGLFFFTAAPNTLLLNNSGILPATGAATAQFHIPNIAELVGLKLYAGGITSNADYLNFVKNFSPSLAITLRR